jgi:hypothetical protein
LRGTKARLHRLLRPLKLDLHPDRTYLDRIDKDFDFAGYHHATRHFSVAEMTRALSRTLLSALQATPPGG